MVILLLWACQAHPPHLICKVPKLLSFQEGCFLSTDLQEAHGREHPQGRIPVPAAGLPTSHTPHLSGAQFPAYPSVQGRGWAQEPSSLKIIIIIIIINNLLFQGLGWTSQTGITTAYVSSSTKEGNCQAERNQGCFQEFCYLGFAADDKITKFRITNSSALLRMAYCIWGKPEWGRHPPRRQALGMGE